MTNKTKDDPGDVVKAFRKAARELGCNQSEQRFQEALFAIGRDKPTRKPPKRRRAARKVILGRDLTDNTT
jgi:hypothetical protein